MREADLTVNMDRICQRCGKPGVAYTKGMDDEAGKYCLTCVTKIMEERMAKEGREKGPLAGGLAVRLTGVKLKTETVKVGDSEMEKSVIEFAFRGSYLPGQADALGDLLKKVCLVRVEAYQGELPV